MSGHILMLTAAIAEATTLPLAGWEKYGTIGILIVAVGAMWMDAKARQSKLENIIQENTKALTETADAIRKCKGPA